MDELRDLVELIAEHGFTDFELEREGFHVRLGRHQSPQEAATPSTAASSMLTPGAGQQQPVQELSASQSPAGGSMQSEATGTTATRTGAPAGAASLEDENLHIITSPIVGTFYRSPSPTAEAFVRIGSHVGPDTVVCIIEAMKLMNEIQAETSGEVAKIYVENGQPVEYGQPLFGIKK